MEKSWPYILLGLTVAFHLINVSQADLVILTAQKRSPSGDRQIVDQLQLCAMRRDAASPDKDGKQFGLVYLNRTDGCRELDPDMGDLLEHKAAFLWLMKTPQCQLAQIAYNVEVHDPAMVIIGTNGPLVPQ